MTSSGSLRRAVVATTIGSFSIAALLGVLALLGSGDFGDGQARILLTTLTVGVSSVAVLCYLATGGTPYERVGLTGGIVVFIPLLTSLILIWGDNSFDEDGLLKTFGVGFVLAATLAQVSLLLVLTRGHKSLRALLVSTLALAGLLAALVSAAILGVEGGGWWRLIGIVAILDVLGTVVAIALGAFGRVGGQKAPGPLTTSAAAIVLPAPLALALDERSRLTGRSREDLAAEALARYLDSGGPRTR
ncbi:hypothetical protein [Nocardioides sp.]|uniref:hypothetical protein n=1 Tax=Nocardioides sp. TaxID=35761 RepID=UPI002B27B118|nr:hypothetical protein [Nocardioides sp.]